MASAIDIKDTLTSLVGGLGTSKDKAASVTYSTPALTDQEAISAYTGAWLPRKAVDQIAKDCFRKWREWQADPVQVGRLEQEEKRLDLRAKFERAMILARLFGRAHVYFDLGDDPSQPVNVNRVKMGGIRFATVISKREIVDGDTDDDPMSPNYGSPRYYELSSPSAGIVRIDPSRLVTFWGDEDPRDMVFGREGRSVLQSAMPAIKRHDGIVANIAHLVFESRLKIISVPGLGDLLKDERQSQAILDRFALFNRMMDNQSIGLLSASSNKDVPGEDFKQFQVSFATLPDVIEKAQEEVSAAVGIPRAMLFGTSAGGLGSTGDLELSNYYDSIGTMQTNDIEPALRVIDECLIRSALGNRPADLWYQWASLWQVSDKEKAEIADKITTSAERLIRMGLSLDIVAEPTISALVQAGTFPGLETKLEEAGDDLEDDPDEGSLPDSNGDTANSEIDNA